MLGKKDWGRPLFWTDHLKIYSITTNSTELASPHGQLDIISMGDDRNANDSRLILKCTKTNRTFLDVKSNEIMLNEQTNRIELKMLNSNVKLHYAIENQDENDSRLIINTLRNVGIKHEYKSSTHNLCVQLCKAIQSGDQTLAAKIASQLASKRVNLLIKEQNLMENIELVDESHEINEMDTNENDQFNVACTHIQDGKENKTMYLEDLHKNMSILDLKHKIFNEYRIPLENQFFIINNEDTNDAEKLINYFECKDFSKQTIHLLDVKQPQPVYNGLDISDIDLIEENMDGWTCDKCTMRNRPYSARCEVCDQRRPEEYTPADKYATRVDNFNAYVSLDTLQINENTEVFDCDICLENNLGPKEGVILKGCLHIFCKSCLRDHINHFDDALVKCPYNKDYVCQSELEDREIRALVSEDEYEQVQQRGLRLVEAQNKNSFHCKTPDCRGFCLVENDQATLFLCPVCDQTNCLNCKEIHMGKTCAEYQEDLRIKKQNDKTAEQDAQAIENMIKRNEAMRCPGCSALCLKDLGCDWCVCLMCKMEICWATKGPRWGPKGNGDTSGGCGCNFMKKKCHPKCQNCH